jgi:hypothetical protein
MAWSRNPLLTPEGTNRFIVPGTPQRELSFPPKHVEGTYTPRPFPETPAGQPVTAPTIVAANGPVNSLQNSLNDLAMQIQADADGLDFLALQKLSEASGEPAPGTPEFISGTFTFNGQSYSGADIKLLALSYRPDIEGKLPDKGRLVHLATASSLSVSVHRTKSPVRACGFVAPKGYVRADRTVAGSIVFAQMDEHALAELLQYPPTAPIAGGKYDLIQIDQIPPMTIVVQLANEYGNWSEMSILGVEFVDEGYVFSIENLFTENTVTYVARDFNIPLKRGDHRLKGGSQADVATSASSLIKDLKNDTEYQNFVRQKNISKRNPFI